MDLEQGTSETTGGGTGVEGKGSQSVKIPGLQYAIRLTSRKFSNSWIKYDCTSQPGTVKSQPWITFRLRTLLEEKLGQYC